MTGCNKRVGLSIYDFNLQFIPLVGGYYYYFYRVLKRVQVVNSFMDRNESVWNDPLGSFYARKYCIASRCNDDGVWVVVG